MAAAIADGVWKPGEKLPAELELARITPFSLGTVQKALAALVEEGLVIRQQGRGTFVQEKRRQMDMPWSLRVIGGEGDKFFPLYPRVLKRKRISPRHPWRSLFPPGVRSFIQIDRLVDVGKEFLVYIKFYVDGERFSDFLRKSVKELESTNFKNILLRDFHIPVTRLDYSLRICPLPGDICGAIRVKRETTGLIYSVVGYSGPDPVYYQETFVPPNRHPLFFSETASPSEGWAVSKKGARPG